MITSKRFRLSKMANRIIGNEMKQRIPFYREFRLDNSPNFVSQIDLYGNVDNLISCGTRNEVDNLAEAPRDVLQIARQCCTMIWKGGANNA